ncbi:MAG: TolC family protein, partial [Polyangiaceae bacterium]|nr:TolC family protein [Polyangiaceae bacterium]
MKPSSIVLPLVLIAIAAVVMYVVRAGHGPLVLTGIVTTHDVLVAPQLGGQVSKLLVHEGDTVARDQLLAVISPDELKAEEAFYSHSAEGLALQVHENEDALRYQEQQTTQQIRQATANLAAAQAQRQEASADFENARVEYERVQQLEKTGAVSKQEVDRVRTTYEMSRAKLDAAERQLEAQQAALALARAQETQVSMKRSAIAASEQERAAAA